MTEKEYRALPIDSYSSFKDFLEDKKRYYKRYVLGEKVEEKDDLAIRMGTLTETLAFQPDEFDNKFYLSHSAKIPTATMLDFTEAAYRRTMEHMGEETLTISFEEVLRLAYNDVKYDKQGNIVAFKQEKASSFEKIVEKFASDCKDYYDEIVNVRPKGLQVVSEEDLRNAEKIKDELFTNPNTAHIMRKKTEQGVVDVYHQFPLIFKILGYEVKSLLDRLEVNHEEKYIQPDDLKVTWNVEEFTEKYYLYRRSDLQAAIYYFGALDYADKNYPNYEVRPMRFIVSDSINYMAPLVYETTQQDIDDAIQGFEHKGKKYIGLSTVINDLKWHKETGIWNISRENFLNKGVCKIKR